MTPAYDVPSGRPATVPTPRPGDPRLSRLSLNQQTAKQCSIPEAVGACVRAGIPAIGVWREPLAETGLRAAARIVADAGLRVSSLCRGGFLTAVGPDARATAFESNRRAIDEAAELGAACLVLVVGGLPEGSRDLRGARARLVEGVGELMGYARERRVRLAIEPLHPVFCADRAVVSTLGQALDLAELFPVGQVGVVVDTFHVWWDPEGLRQIARAGQRIAGFQVSDWVTPLSANILLGRGMMGDGHIDFHSLREAVDAAGYIGDVEVEIFNAEVWAAEIDAVLATVVRRYVEHVLAQ